MSLLSFLLIFQFALFVHISLAQRQNRSQIQSNEQPNIANPPTIGILSQPSGFSKFNTSEYSYIYNSYVQYFQQAGARIIPLKYTDSITSLKRQISQLNGLVIPGGGSNLMYRNPGQESGQKEFTRFAKVGIALIEFVKKRNDQGIYTPIWGTCLGFELLALSFAKKEIRSKVPNESNLKGILLSPNHSLHSRILSMMSSHLQQIISNSDNLFYFNHRYAFKPNKFLKDSHFKPVAYSLSKSNQKFVAIAEANDYPFFGVQFHPEKVQFDPSEDQRIGSSISLSHLEVAQYFANFFVFQCSKSPINSNFSNNALISSYQLKKITGNNQLVYLFSAYNSTQNKIHPIKQQNSTNQQYPTRDGKTIISRKAEKKELVSSNQKELKNNKLITKQKMNQKVQTNNNYPKQILQSVVSTKKAQNNKRLIQSTSISKKTLQAKQQIGQKRDEIYQIGTLNDESCPCEREGYVQQVGFREEQGLQRIQLLMILSLFLISLSFLFAIYLLLSTKLQKQLIKIYLYFFPAKVSSEIQSKKSD